MRILVTGAGGRMGGALARACAREGARLVLTSRSATRIEALAAELGAVAIRADFLDDAQVDRLAQVALDAFGGIDGVILSSQPAEPALGDLLTTREADWREQQQAIAWGPFRLVKALAPGMIAAGGGSILAITSSTGSEPVPGYGAYGLAKAMLWTLTRYIAAEWGQYGIRANAIMPGSIATGGPGAPRADAPPAAMLARTPLGRLGTSAEVAGAAVFLLSDEASYVTGQNVSVNGGRI